MCAAACPSIPTLPPAAGTPPGRPVKGVSSAQNKKGPGLLSEAQNYKIYKKGKMILTL